MRGLVLTFLSLCFLICQAPALPDYRLIQLTESRWGWSALYSLHSGSGPFGHDPSFLLVNVTFEKSDRIRFRITDPNSTRWEVFPELLHDRPIAVPTKMNYEVSFPPVGSSGSFLLVIRRKMDGRVIFNATAVVFEPQYLSLTNSFAETEIPNLYGLGDRVFPFRLEVPNSYTLWNRARYFEYVNIYSSHPVYFAIEPYYPQDKDNDDCDDVNPRARCGGGHPHGVFLFNSNAMEVTIQDDSITYQTAGGIFDFFVFVGDRGTSAEEIVGAYHRLIGTPKLVPKWSLGWHQSRYGYQNISVVKEVVENYAKFEIPLDCIWTDIDYMWGSRDFTLDPVHFPLPGVQDFVKYLHSNNQHYVLILDPFLAVDEAYEPYECLISSGAYVRRFDGVSPLYNRGRPGYFFPDWTHENVSQAWRYLIQKFRDQVGFSGLWIDMNEPQGYCDKECYPSKEVFDPENPPWTPTGADMLDQKTLAMNAVMSRGIMYNLHNLYGLLQAKETSRALEQPSGTPRTQKRSFVLTRSTWPGAGSFASHWTGDNIATFADMRRSISMILNSQLSGVTHVGADVCGFALDTTRELCARWTLLSIVYPFARNHNTKKAKSQEPWALGLQNLTRDAMSLRYSLLQFLYTDFARINMEGGLFWKALAFEYSTETIVAGIDNQFLVADSLLVSPLTEFVGRLSGVFPLRAYFPSDRWYNFYDPPSFFDSKGEWKELEVSLERLPIHIRGGRIIPIQKPARTTAKMESNPFRLIVALTPTGFASGRLFFDDGESLDTIPHGQYSLVQFSASPVDDQLKIGEELIQFGYPKAAKVLITSASVVGLSFDVREVFVNGSRFETWAFDPKTRSLEMSHLTLAIASEFEIVLKN